MSSIVKNKEHLDINNIYKLLNINENIFIYYLVILHLIGDTENGYLCTTAYSPSFSAFLQVLDLCVNMLDAMATATCSVDSHSPLHADSYLLSCFGNANSLQKSVCAHVNSSIFRGMSSHQL